MGSAINPILWLEIVDGVLVILVALLLIWGIRIAERGNSDLADELFSRAEDLGKLALVLLIILIILAFIAYAAGTPTK